MRGQLWDMFVILLTLGFLIFVVNTAFTAIGEVIKLNAVVNQEKITGVINVLQSSPPVTRQVYTLPEGECSLVVKAYGPLAIVNMTTVASGTRQSALGELLMTGVAIDDANVECSDRGETRVYFTRCANAVRITTSELVC